MVTTVEAGLEGAPQAQEQSSIHRPQNASATTAPSAPAGFTARIGRIEISATMAITAEAAKLRAAGRDLVDFGAGEPHFPTPPHIKDAAIQAIEQNFTRYTTVGGIPEVRKAICDRHRADFGSDYSPEEAMFTVGGKMGLFEAMQVLVQHGDEVILPVPYWVSYKDIIEYGGGVPVYLQTDEKENFRITAQAIEARITPKTRVIILNSPSNPSGAVVSPEDIEAIVRLAHARGIWLILDECYVYLQYDGNRVSGGSFKDCKSTTVVLGSLSKTYAMTGWRAGFVLAPAPLIKEMTKLQSQSTSSPAAPVQKAVIAALTGSQDCVEQMRKDYLSLRDETLFGLTSIPNVTCTVPQGAFYVYPNVSAYIGTGPGKITNTLALAERLLHEADVVVVPGDAFGTRGHIRLSYAVSHEAVAEGVRRMKQWFEGLQ